MLKYKENPDIDFPPPLLIPIWKQEGGISNFSNKFQPAEAILDFEGTHHVSKLLQLKLVVGTGEWGKRRDRFPLIEQVTPRDIAISPYDRIMFYTS